MNSHIEKKLHKRGIGIGEKKKTKGGGGRGEKIGNKWGVSKKPSNIILRPEGGWKGGRKNRVDKAAT